MFISKAEKEFFHSTIANLQLRLLNLEHEIGRLKAEVSYKRPTIIANEKAPWGTKKDGTPRGRPGRPRLVMKVGAK